jgi:exosortase/archaeosortase family protein
MVAAFVVNAVRVALLGLTGQAPDASGLAQLTSFDFWHDGTGSHVFSLAAMLIVCGAYVLALEVHLRQSRSSSA